MRAALCRARVASPPTRRRVVASRAAMDVTFVTSNARKLAEARAILGATPALTLTSRALDLPELQGEPEDVARAKARRAAVVVGGPALVEDTSLCYDALGGLPGVYVKWFLEKTGPEGLVDALAAYDDKSAEALCVLAYATGPEDEDAANVRGATARANRAPERVERFRMGLRVRAGGTRGDVRGDGRGDEEFHLAQVSRVRAVSSARRAIRA